MFADKGLTPPKGICILIGDCYKNSDPKEWRYGGKLPRASVGILEQGALSLHLNTFQLGQSTALPDQFAKWHGHLPNSRTQSPRILLVGPDGMSGEASEELRPIKATVERLWSLLGAELTGMSNVPLVEEADLNRRGCTKEEEGGSVGAGRFHLPAGGIHPTAVSPHFLHHLAP